MGKQSKRFDHTNKAGLRIGNSCKLLLIALFPSFLTSCATVMTVYTKAFSDIGTEAEVTIEEADILQADTVSSDWYDWQECSQVTGEYGLGGCDRGGFITAMNAIIGASNIEFFFISKASSGTTEIEYSQNAATLTFANNINTMEPTALGQIQSITFDRSASDDSSTPDTADLSFGDGSTDNGFSWIALVDMLNGSNTKCIFSKDNGGAAQEYFVDINLTTLRWRMRDESASANIQADSSGAMSTGTWMLLGGSYDGSGAYSGISLYVDGSAISTSDSSIGSYTAMENLGDPLHVGSFSGGSNYTSNM